MPDNKLKVLYDAVSKDFDLGSYDDFLVKIHDPKKRQIFHQAVGQEYDLGDYNSFEQKVQPYLAPVGPTMAELQVPTQEPGLAQQQPIPPELDPNQPTQKPAAQAVPVKSDNPLSKIKPDEVKESTKNLEKGLSFNDIIDQSFVKPYYSTLAGVYGATAGTFQMLDNWADFISEKTGADKGGLFGNLADTYIKYATEAQNRGINAEKGGIAGVQKSIYEGLGSAGIVLPEIMSVGLVPYMAAQKGSERIQENKDITQAKYILEHQKEYDDEAVKLAKTIIDRGDEIGSVGLSTLIGALEGYIMHRGFKLISTLPTPERIATGGAAFGGMAAAEGGTPEEVVGSTIVGGALNVAGPKGKEYRKGYLQDVGGYWARKLSEPTMRLIEKDVQKLGGFNKVQDKYNDLKKPSHRYAQEYGREFYSSEEQVTRARGGEPSAETIRGNIPPVSKETGKQEKGPGDRRQDRKQTPQKEPEKVPQYEPTQEVTVTNKDDGVEAKVTPMKDGRYVVTLKDLDSGEQLETMRIFPADRFEDAKKHAENIANIQETPEGVVPEEAAQAKKEAEAISKEIQKSRQPGKPKPKKQQMRKIEDSPDAVRFGVNEIVDEQAIKDAIIRLDEAAKENRVTGQETEEEQIAKLNKTQGISHQKHMLEEALSQFKKKFITYSGGKFVEQDYTKLQQELRDRIIGQEEKPKSLIDYGEEHIDKRGNWTLPGDVLNKELEGRSDQEIIDFIKWTKTKSRHVERTAAGNAAAILRSRGVPVDEIGFIEKAKKEESLKYSHAKQIEVPRSRLQNDADIDRSHLEGPTVRAPFRYKGDLYVGVAKGGGMGHLAYKIVPRDQFKGDIKKTYNEGKDNMKPYKFKGKEVVLVEPIEFLPAEGNIYGTPTKGPKKGVLTGPYRDRMLKEIADRYRKIGREDRAKIIEEKIGKSDKRDFAMITEDDLAHQLSLVEKAEAKVLASADMAAGKAKPITPRKFNFKNFLGETRAKESKIKFVEPGIRRKVEGALQDIINWAAERGVDLRDIDTGYYEKENLKPFAEAKDLLSYITGSTERLANMKEAIDKGYKRADQKKYNEQLKTVEGYLKDAEKYSVKDLTKKPSKKKTVPESQRNLRRYIRDRWNGVSKKDLAEHGVIEIDRRTGKQRIVDRVLYLQLVPKKGTEGGKLDDMAASMIDEGTLTVRGDENPSEVLWEAIYDNKKLGQIGQTDPFAASGPDSYEIQLLTEMYKEGQNEGAIPEDMSLEDFIHENTAMSNNSYEPPVENTDALFEPGAKYNSQKRIVQITDFDAITPDQWAKINNFMRDRGYDYRGPEDARELFRIQYQGRNTFSGDHADALRYGLDLETLPPIKELIKNAVKYFGITENASRAGFLLPDGRMLDFGAPGYEERVLDHSEISQFVPDELDNLEEYGHYSTYHMLAQNKINRMMVTGKNGDFVRIMLGGKPTPDQVKTLRKMFNTYPKEVWIDLIDPTDYLNQKQYLEYGEGTRADKIFQDIDYYYTNGKLPPVSNLLQFRSPRVGYTGQTTLNFDKAVKPKGEPEIKFTNKPRKVMPKEMKHSYRPLKEGEEIYLERKYKRYKNLKFFAGSSQVNGPEDVAYMFRQLEGESVEHLFLLHITGDGKQIIQHVSTGTFSQSLADQAVMVDAIERFGTKELYFVHNHPSGVLRPSNDDLKSLARLRSAFTGIKVHDGIIIDIYKNKFVTFDEFKGIGKIGPTDKGRDVKELPALSFSRLYFRNPSKVSKGLTSPDAVAGYLSGLRFSPGEKVMIITVDNANQVVGRFYLSPDGMYRTWNATNEIAALVSRSGGTGAFLAVNGTDYFMGDHGEGFLTLLREGLEKKNIRLLDVLRVEPNANTTKYKSLHETGAEFFRDKQAEYEKEFINKKAKEGVDVRKIESVQTKIEKREKLKEKLAEQKKKGQEDIFDYTAKKQQLDLFSEPVQNYMSQAVDNEKIVEAVVEVSGKKYFGRSHYDAIMSAMKDIGEVEFFEIASQAKGFFEGFRSNTGKIYSRTEAADKFLNRGKREEEKGFYDSEYYSEYIDLDIVKDMSVPYIAKSKENAFTVAENKEFKSIIEEIQERAVRIHRQIEEFVKRKGEIPFSLHVDPEEWGGVTDFLVTRSPSDINKWRVTTIDSHGPASHHTFESYKRALKWVLEFSRVQEQKKTLADAKIPDQYKKRKGPKFGQTVLFGEPLSQYAASIPFRNGDIVLPDAFEPQNDADTLLGRLERIMADEIKLRVFEYAKTKAGGNLSDENNNRYLKLRSELTARVDKVTEQIKKSFDFWLERHRDGEGWADQLLDISGEFNLFPNGLEAFGVYQHHGYGQPPGEIGLLENWKKNIDVRQEIVDKYNEELAIKVPGNIEEFEQSLRDEGYGDSIEAIKEEHENEDEYFDALQEFWYENIEPTLDGFPEVYDVGELAVYWDGDWTNDIGQIIKEVMETSGYQQWRDIFDADNNALTKAEDRIEAAFKKLNQAKSLDDKLAAINISLNVEHVFGKMGEHLDLGKDDLSRLSEIGNEIVSLETTPQIREPGPEYKFERPEIEEEYQASHGITKPSLKERIKEKMLQLEHELTRGKFEFLPRTAEFAQIRSELLRLGKQKDVAHQKTLDTVDALVSKMSKNQYSMYERLVLLSDLMEEVKVEHTLPGNWTEAEVGNEYNRLLAESDDTVKRAFTNRKAIWDDIVDAYIEAQEKIGFHVEGRFDRNNYFRHQVLEFANAKGLTGTGQRLKTPTGRGFLKQREGSHLSINTNYLQAEYEVMSQMLYDIQRARVIEAVDRLHNIQDQLKGEAKSANEENVMPFFEEIAAQMTNSLAPNSKRGPYTAEEAFRIYLNTKIAIGMSKLGKMASEGNLSHIVSNEDFGDVIDDLAEVHNINQAAKADFPDEPEMWRAASLKDMGRFFKYIAEVVKDPNYNSQAKLGAATVFKGIREKNEFIKDALGDKFQTWETMIPEGYVKWQPREGQVIYFANSIPERAARDLFEGAMEEVGISKDMIRKVMAIGGARKEYVIPEELANQLDKLVIDTQRDFLSKFMKWSLTKWKIWTLISPRRYFKYNARNLTGDADAVFIGNPRGFLKTARATRELYQVFTGQKKLTDFPDLNAWFEHGGMGTLLQAQEMGDLNKLKQFKKFDKKMEGKTDLNVIRKYFRFARLSTDMREAILRYANYLEYLEQIRANPESKPKNYGASIPSEVDALETPEAKAFWLSNDLLGAYDDVSVFGQQLRSKFFPFWSWKEVNFKRYVRFIKNTANTPDIAEQVGRRVVKGAPVLAMKVGSFIIRAIGLWSLMQAWNQLFFSDEEDDLPRGIKKTPHLIFGRNDEGEVIYFNRLGALGDFLEWFGLQDAPYLVTDWMNGRTSIGEVAEGMAKAPVNVFVQGARPEFKIPAELISGESFFPDVFNPRSIKNKGLHVARGLGLQDEYIAIANLPTKGYTRSLRNFFYYEIDPHAAAYMDIYDAKDRYMREVKGETTGAYSVTSPKSMALYNMKLSLKYQDKEAAERYFMEYINYGGTGTGLRRSIMTMHPKAGLSKEDLRNFLENYITPEERRKWDLAVEFFDEVIAKDVTQLGGQK